ncbi:2-oxoacid:acceptor oxidoreductase family protein [bacterium]|nr:2-oxoacid:acceptor oxidoreductase family protein [bacterium]
MSNKNTFNLIIAGYGGQGVLTMAKIIAYAAMFAGYDVKQAELHGLAQRGGSLICQVRFGKKVYSPLIRQGNADLIIGLEILETLHACYYADKNKTIILANSEFYNPYLFEQKGIDSQKIIKDIKSFGLKTELISASKIIKKVIKDTAMINTFMTSYAVEKKLLPIREKFILQAMKEKFRKIFWEDNLKVFQIAKLTAKNK